MRRLGLVCLPADLLNGECLAELCDEFVGSVAVQILHHAVVVHYLKLVAGEEDRKEEIEFFAAVVVGKLLAALEADLDRRSRSVVTVGDVEVVDSAEERSDAGVCLGAVDDPNGVGDAVLGHEIIDGGVIIFPIRNYGGDIALRAIGQEYRAGVGIAVVDVIYPVRFLIGTGQLVLLDDVVDIVVDGYAADKAGLAPAVHYLAVDVETGVLILLAYAVAHELVEILPRLEVDLLGVEVGARGQVDLRLVDVQKRMRLALDHFGSFGAAHNVIGQGCDLRGVLRHRAYRFERLKNCHCYHPSVIFIRICYINIKSLSIIYFYIAFLFFVLYNYYIL